MKYRIVSLTITLLMYAVSFSLSAMPTCNNHAGYAFGKAEMPDGSEWESPRRLALNKELPRARFFSFPDCESALKVLPDGSKYFISLDGKWRFKWSRTPEERPQDFFAEGFDSSGWDEITVPSNWNVKGIGHDGSLKYGKPIYVNQKVIFQHHVAPDDWRGGVMRTPPETWTTFTDRNEVGSYQREFSIPDDWEGRQTYILFDGVDSFFYLWINGQYVGFSKNSRCAARFNITRFIHSGSNTVSVEVYRNSDGSFLEAQDMFRLPGIFRSVSLYSTPDVSISDLIVTPDLDNFHKNGSLDIKAYVKNQSKKDVKGYSVRYSLFPLTLYSDSVCGRATATLTSEKMSVKKGADTMINSTIQINEPRKWSAEEPNRYVLVAELTDLKGKVIETISAFVGFRKVELREMTAGEDEFGNMGRYFLINEKPVKLKGVNRHESDPMTGHSLTHEKMMRDIIMMKRANINHVRNSHYPDDPYWYYLCDRYGIYLEDEANIESHEYYYGKASLSHPEEWREAHVARVMEMARSNVNHPSIVIWSLGNEAGPGDNFKVAYDSLKAFDASRPVQYERNNDIVDIGSNQYPSIRWTREAAKGNLDIKYPFHISEYAHSMGNSLGNLCDYWEAIESSNHLIGGAIWDWVDQAIYNYTPDGVRYLAYGGDFGDFPNDGQFVMNGIMFADMTPKPQYNEVKKVYQNVSVRPVDIEKGKIEIFNKNYFTTLDDFEVEWSLLADGDQVGGGKLGEETRNIGPRSSQMISVPYDYTDLDTSKEYHLNIYFKLRSDKPWAKKGYIQMAEQLPVKSAITTQTLHGTEVENTTLTSVNDFSVTGADFNVSFDEERGGILTLVYENDILIAPGHGPKLDVFRAFTNNDNWFYKSMFEHGLHNLRHHAVSSQRGKDNDGNSIFRFTIVSQAPNAARIHGGTSSGHSVIEERTDSIFSDNDLRFITRQAWTVKPSGEIVLDADVVSNDTAVVIPRIGFAFELPEAYNRIDYLGRGHEENYPDRKTGSFIGHYHSTTDKEFVNYPKPQSMANHEDCRRVAFTNDAGEGLEITSDRAFSFSALPYSEMQLILAPHPHELTRTGMNYIHIDSKVTGLGGNSCGQGGPLEKDVTRAARHHITFTLKPIRKAHRQAN